MGKRVSKFETALRQAFRNVPDANIDLALALMRLELDPVRACERPELAGFDGSRSLYLNRREMIMRQLDHLLQTHGVECLGGDPDNHRSHRWEYLNVGESYAPTVVWYRSSGRFYVRCWADIVEAYRLK